MTNAELIAEVRKSYTDGKAFVSWALVLPLCDALEAAEQENERLRGTLVHIRRAAQGRLQEGVEELRWFEWRARRALEPSQLSASLVEREEGQ